MAGSARFRVKRIPGGLVDHTVFHIFNNFVVEKQKKAKLFIFTYIFLVYHILRVSGREEYENIRKYSDTCKN